MSKPMTLDDFSKRILRPSVLRDIKNGALDGALGDPDVLEILADDNELASAAIERIKIISSAHAQAG